MPTSLLERETQNEEVLSPEAEQHNEKIREIYNSIFSFQTTDEQAAASAALVMGVRTEERPSFEGPAPDLRTEQRREEATQILFSDSSAVAAPARAPEAELEYTDRPIRGISAREEEGEDARPTQKTMNTLRRGSVSAIETSAEIESAAEPTEKVSLWASLSSRTKLVLSIVALAVFFALALVCINSGIIRSIDKDIAAKQMQLQALSQQSRQVRAQIEEVTDPANVDEYAEYVLGMVKESK